MCVHVIVQNDISCAFNGGDTGFMPCVETPVLSCSIIRILSHAVDQATGVVVCVCVCVCVFLHLDVQEYVDICRYVP